MTYKTLRDNFKTEMEYFQKIQLLKQETININEITIKANTIHSIQNIACVFVDMVQSSQIAKGVLSNAVRTYIPYLNTLVKCFQEFDCKYIDIQGDGGFALYDGVNSREKSLYVAAMINSFFNKELSMNIRIGIDYGSVYVKKIGNEKYSKEVWLGRPVCTASKLCNIKHQIIPANVRFTSSVFISELLNNNRSSTHHIYIENLDTIFYSDLLIDIRL